MKKYKVVDVQIHIFFTLELGGGEWSALFPIHFIPRGKESPVPIVYEAYWAPELFWTM
jgi:hypothetical protein